MLPAPFGEQLGDSDQHSATPRVATQDAATLNDDILDGDTDALASPTPLGELIDDVIKHSPTPAVATQDAATLSDANALSAITPVLVVGISYVPSILAPVCGPSSTAAGALDATPVGGSPKSLR